MRRYFLYFLSNNFIHKKIKPIGFNYLSYYHYTYAKPSLDYINYINRLPETLPNKILKPIIENQQILDFDDKFGLGNIKEARVILNHLKATNFSYSFNDLRYFLRRIEQIHQEKPLNTKFDLIFKKFVSKIKTQLKNNDHEAYPYIGTYAHCLMKLNVNDKELWELLENKIREDQFYTNFKEVAYACEGFKMLNIFNDQERIDYVYKRLERIVTITIWENNMLYYKRIAEALVVVNRFSSEVFFKLEHHIMNNLSMEYELETMVDILIAFSKSGNGTKNFYDSMQYVLVKGHMFNKNILLENRIELPFQGRVMANIVETYAKISKAFDNFEIEANFRVMIYKMITNKRMNYELIDIVNIIKNITCFKYEEENLLVETIINKIPQIDCTISFEEIRKFLNLMLLNNKIEMIPMNIKEFLENYIINNIGNHSPEENLKIYMFLTENKLYLNLDMINLKMMEFLNNNLYKIDVAILKLFVEKLQEKDENILKLSTFKQMNNYFYLNKINDKNENKNYIEDKKIY